MYKLPVREFSEVIESLMGPKDSAAASENRRATRYTVSAKLDVHLIDQGKPHRSFSVLIRDISMTGVGLMQSVALPSGQLFALGLPRKVGLLYMECRAMHCRSLADGLMSVGADFVRIMSDQEAASLRTSLTNEQERLRQSILS